MNNSNDRLKGKRILVVEDEILIALYNQDLLQDWGCRVLGPAYSVSAALELLDAELPDAAIIDFALRGETSEPVAEALLTANRPFVLTTAYDPEHLGENTAGAPLLRKPVFEEDLRIALVDLFSP